MYNLTAGPDQTRFLADLRQVITELPWKKPFLFGFTFDAMPSTAKAILGIIDNPKLSAAEKIAAIDRAVIAEFQGTGIQTSANVFVYRAIASYLTAQANDKPVPRIDRETWINTYNAIERGETPLAEAITGWAAENFNKTGDIFQDRDKGVFHWSVRRSYGSEYLYRSQHEVDALRESDAFAVSLLMSTHNKGPVWPEFNINNVKQLHNMGFNPDYLRGYFSSEYAREGLLSQAMLTHIREIVRLAAEPVLPAADRRDALLIANVRADAYADNLKPQGGRAPGGD